MWEILDTLSNVILQFCDGPIVEIGIGKSTRVFAKYAEKYKVDFYSCDIKNHSKLLDNHFPFIGPSQEFIKTFDGNPAIVLLDGNHNYPTVTMEVDFFLPKLKKGGVMFLHDTLPPTKGHLARSRCSNSFRVREELEANKDVMCFTWPYTAMNCGLTMVMEKPINFHLEEAWMERRQRDRK